MSLESGTYTIKNKASGTCIGRNPVEDRSLNPKRVLSLPPGGDAPRWNIQKDGNDYKMMIRGASATELDGLVKALLMGQQGASKWCITPQPQHGTDMYTVEVADKSQGWVLPTNEPETQVAVQPLISTKSLPPQFRPNALFEITRTE
ncbi:hypothetical protein FRB94_008559 [Tulasnella sp. JGI-2019a]|nr:hypothetical protein FRB94_008559 [Tulasnella sp. JGI-2019a]KAG9010630.1 hypothetical protein FRB93_003898 [Tulasnella sp. JGI-2019a]KAG9027022.1 hypothetical protein FRB95_008187 [Tulasnella sp. JGI-2019a]